jgi:hypothetical protein
LAQKVGNGLDLQNQKIVSLGDPSANTDAANKQYVDGVARGLRWKESVRAASTTNGALATAYENGDSLDGITLATGDRILLKDQTTATENGIYVVAASGAPARAADLAATSDAKGIAVTVTNGTINNDRVYIQTADPAVVGTNNLAFSQLGGGGTAYTAGDGLAESPAGTFNVTPGTGLEISSDAIRIAAAAAGDGLTGGGGSALAVNPGTGLEISSDAVRIATTAAGDGLTGGGGSALAVDTASVARRVAANVGDNSATSIAVTHNLGTRDVSVEVYRNSTPWDSIICDVERNSTSQVTLKFATAPTTNEYRVVVS